jgi:hypothetical protein
MAEDGSFVSKMQLAQVNSIIGNDFTFDTEMNIVTLQFYGLLDHEKEIAMIMGNKGSEKSTSTGGYGSS